MGPFLRKFFPSVLKKAAAAKTNLYCVYDSQVLTAFTSSLYIAGLAASLVASRLTSALGRRNIMVLGGSTFLVGAAINGAASDVAMLILGRILLGFGVGFTNQVNTSNETDLFSPTLILFNLMYKYDMCRRPLCTSPKWHHPSGAVRSTQAFSSS